MSLFVGKLKKTIRLKVKIIKKLTRKSWDKTDQKKYLYILSDQMGNIITIVSASNTFKLNEEWELEGKVKGHRQFNGTNQTHIVGWSMTYR